MDCDGVAADGVHKVARTSHASWWVNAEPSTSDTSVLCGLDSIHCCNTASSVGIARGGNSVLLPCVPPVDADVSTGSLVACIAVFDTRRVCVELCLMEMRALRADEGQKSTQAGNRSAPMLVDACVEGLGPGQQGADQLRV